MDCWESLEAQFRAGVIIGRVWNGVEIVWIERWNPRVNGAGQWRTFELWHSRESGVGS